MSEGTVTYSELKLRHAERAKSDRRHPTSKERAITCTVILGTICFLLLLAVAILGHMYFQKACDITTQEVQNTQENSTSSPGSEGDSAVPADTGIVSGSLVTQDHCFRRNCYYFSKEELTWDQSEKSCQNMNSSLVKIDDKEEQTFIQSKINYTYWIGLYRIEAEHKWKWQDGTELTEKLTFYHTIKMDRKCGFINSRFIFVADCTIKHCYICEKNKHFFNN
ncbi:killer cell lectin-like receptor 6 [Ochotona princeps]|uniref:killer cell lectin-like receptor 6 n=1 Tax=Ochotona princeps TaxID=9978 RepID=UPI002714A6B2|nr:killer cell lectin-like receptor 6 [Ochotona princeps]